MCQGGPSYQSLDWVILPDLHPKASLSSIDLRKPKVIIWLQNSVEQLVEDWGPESKIVGHNLDRLDP